MESSIALLEAGAQIMTADILGLRPCDLAPVSVCVCVSECVCVCVCVCGWVGGCVGVRGEGVCVTYSISCMCMYMYNIICTLCVHHVIYMYVLCHVICHVMCHVICHVSDVSCDRS